MNLSIVPPGYATIPSQDQIRKGLLDERAAELSNASPKDRKRLLKEIEDEVRKKLKVPSHHDWPHVCW